ncbi:MAG TPA: hypothetical protein VIM58_10005 [Candidatus Methylacidiphilales bacterium]
MSWEGALRDVAAIARRLEIEAARQQRLQEKQRVLFAKHQEHEAHRLEAEEFDERIEKLVSVHKSCGEPISWTDILNTPPPAAPSRHSGHEARALEDLEAYSPSFAEKLFKKAEDKRHALEEAVETAKMWDEAEYEDRYRQHTAKQQAWEKARRFAESVLNGDARAYLTAIEDMQPLAEMAELGCRYNFAIHSPHLIEVALTVDGDRIVPSQIKSLTATGKLSVKKMPPARFAELYQDYVCGCVLRIGREFCAMLPVEQVLVNAYAEMLNPQTGYQEVTPVLGVALPRQTLERLNFDAVDPSDAMRNFIHRMGFRRSEGFSAIDVLTVAEVPAS